MYPDLDHSGEAPDGVSSLLAEIQIGIVGPLCWSPGSRPQHIVSDRVKAVTAPSFFRAGSSILMFIA